MALASEFHVVLTNEETASYLVKRHMDWWKARRDMYHFRNDEVPEVQHSLDR